MSKLIIFVTFFFGGVSLGLIFKWGIFYALFFVLLGLISSILMFWRKDERLLYIIVIFCALSLGIFRIDITGNETNTFLNEKLNQEITFQGVIVDNPEKRERSLRFVVRDEGTDEKILIYSEKFLNLDYGDKVLIEGELEKPENFEGLGGRVFDYENYLAKDDIYYQIFYPKVSKEGSGYGNFIKEKLFFLKNILVFNIKKVIPSPESTLLAGLLFGEKGSFSDSLEENFRKTGLIHIVVLSGYNVSIIADSIMKVLSVASFSIAAVLGGISIIFFAIMTGLSATTVRASIMALLVIMARLTGRRYDIIRALFVAGFLMVFLNPKIILFDPGFQLSFMATLGLILVSPIISEKLTFIKSRAGNFLKELFSATISTQIFVLPILLYQIGEVSFIAPISNLIILPLIPLTMLFGFITSIFVFLGKFLGFIPGYLSFLLLHFEIGTVNFMGELPFASIIFPKIPFVLIPIFYFAIFYLLWRTENKKKLIF